jgi:tetratricopeptide (TPR) repeat protein
MPTAVRSGVQRGNGRGPELPPLVGRDDALDHYRRTRETAAKVLLCFYGVIKIGKTALLEAIEQEARDNGDYPVLVDLDRHGTRVEAGEVVRAKLTRRRRWRLMTRFAVIQEHLVEHRAYAERGDPSGGIRGLPGKVLHGVWRLGRRVLRRGQVRWAEEQLEQLPPGGTRAAERARVERLEQLLPVALALDIDELARRSDRRIVLLFDHHERSRAAVAASQRQDDMVLALTQLLHERDASVTVVVARDSPLDPGTGYWTHNGEADSHGAIRSDRLQHRRLEQVSREHARECLERMGLEEPLIGRLVDLCMGHPGVLVGCARYGVVPTVMRDLDDDVGIREVLTDVLRQMLDRLDDADRRLLRLAATVRAFDRSLLDKLAGGPAVEWEWYQDKKRAGLIEPVRDAEGAESAWRVEPVWRALLFRDLASGRDRQLFRHGHTVALGHLEGLTAPAGDDQRFALELERAYHSAALSPEDGLDELVRMADRQLADHRDDRWAKILEAAKQLYSLEGRDEAKAVLLEAKFLSDVRRYDDARRLLEEASKRFPIDGSFGFPGVSIALELAKLNRLRGFYSTAASRYRELEAGALQAGNDAVAAHCAWGLSLVYKQLGDFPKARTKLVEAKDGVDVVLRDDPAGAERAARRFGIRKLAVKPAHLLRHEAELDRLQGLYASAHDRLDDALALYADGESRATAYGNAVRAHLLRLEGRLDEAVELAE